MGLKELFSTPFRVCMVEKFRRINSPKLERAVRISYRLGYRGVYGGEGTDHAAN